MRRSEGAVNFRPIMYHRFRQSCATRFRQRCTTRFRQYCTTQGRAEWEARSTTGTRTGLAEWLGVDMDLLFEPTAALGAIAHALDD
jgi:hypothetical protein